MLVPGLIAAVAVVVLVIALVLWRGIARRRSRVQSCVTEEQARGNAAPLTTAILSASRRRDRGETVA